MPQSRWLSGVARRPRHGREDMVVPVNTASEIDNQLYADQVRMLYAAAPISLTAIAVNATVLAAVLWSVVSQSLIVSWLGFVLVLTAWRASACWLFQRYTPTSSSMRPWGRLFLTGVVLSGLSWGAAVYLLFPGGHPALQLFVIVVVAGMAAGAVTTLSSMLSAALLFLVPALLPLVVRALGMDPVISAPMVGMVAFFFLMVSASAVRFRNTIVQSLRMRYARDRAEAQVAYYNQYDTLTGLPRRVMLLELLEQDMARCQRTGHKGALLFVDLDRLKTINDSLGHSVGDSFVIETARRLRNHVRREDVVARSGGDEFAIMLTELNGNDETAASEARNVALKLQALIGRPYDANGMTLHMSASVGITLYPLQTTDSEAVLQQAGAALSRAKAAGRNASEFYLPDMQEAILERIQLENDLREALDLTQLSLAIQPQVDVDGKVVGAEALLRWQHPERGSVPPAAFIPVAEETGMIISIGEWVLRRGCQILASWQSEDEVIACPRLSINVSPTQFTHDSFVETVRNALAEADVDPCRLELEITEELLLDNVEKVAGKMRELSELGIQFAIDDFGTGYSSLRYLKNLPLDTLKIDKTFVRDVATDSNNGAIVRAIIAVAHHLGLRVVAEGVESYPEAQFLHDQGCSIYQGYYYSEPQPEDNFVPGIRAGHRWIPTDNED